jgi:hypothetical protein
MMTGLKRRGKFALTAAMIVTPAILLQGCYEDDYLSRRDTVSLGAGDAIAVNKATHTIDPWPAHAKDTDIHLEGERARVAIQRYQQNKSIPPRGLSTTEITGQAGPGPQATAQVKE